jgi:hypothetical protein
MNYHIRIDRHLIRAAGGSVRYALVSVIAPQAPPKAGRELLAVTARDANIALQLHRGVEAAPLGAFETATTKGGVQIRLGDLVSGQQLDVVVALKFPAGHDGDTIAVQIGLSDRDGALVAPPQALGWSYATDRAQQGQARAVIVDRAVGRLYAARARAEALELNREGKFDEARARFEKTARRILDYAGDDAELKAMAEALRAGAADYAQMMDARSMKQRYFDSYSISNNRAPDRKARR